MLEPSEIIHAAPRLAGKEVTNLADCPIDGGAVLRRIKNGTFADRLPSRAEQLRIVLWKEKQGKNDVLKHAARLAQILLQKIGPGEFDDAPATRLREHGTGYQKDGVPGFQDPIPQGSERIATVGIIVTIQPGDYFFLLQGLEERKNEPLTILTAVRQEYVMRTRREELKLPQHACSTLAVLVVRQP